MTVQCGKCQNEVFIGQQRVVICEQCKAAIAAPGVPIWEVVAAMRAAGLVPVDAQPKPFRDEMADWAQRHGVTPLHPEQVRADAAQAFGRRADDATREDFYAAWSVYDAALLGMHPQQQDLQRKSELLELERQFAL